MKCITGIFLLIAFLGSSIHAQTTAQAAEQEVLSVARPIMDLETTEIDYGVIQQHADPYREFKFTNTGNAPLIISNAKGSCGCTVPEWSKEPIGPGESSIIKVRYATNRLGKFTKTVTLTTNEDENTHVLKIKGEVLKPKQEESIPAAPPSGFGNEAPNH